MKKENRQKILEAIDTLGDLETYIARAIHYKEQINPMLIFQSISSLSSKLDSIYKSESK